MKLAGTKSALAAAIIGVAAIVGSTAAFTTQASAGIKIKLPKVCTQVGPVKVCTR